MKSSEIVKNSSAVRKLQFDKDKETSGHLHEAEEEPDQTVKTTIIATLSESLPYTLDIKGDIKWY